MVIKKTIYAVLITCLAVVSSNFGMKNNENKNAIVNIKKTDLELFLEKFAPPKELRDLIEKNKKNIEFGSILKGETTSWICKGSRSEAVERIVNAWRCNKLIEKYNLNHLGVVLKYAYKINNDIWAFAELVNPTISKKHTLTNEQIRQLAFFAYKTCFIDFGAHTVYGIFFGHNIVQQDHKLILIDTEDKSFGSQWDHYEELSNISARISTNPELTKWLIKYDNLRRQKKIKESRCSIAQNKEYDDLGIDFEKVKREENIFFKLLITENILFQLIISVREYFQNKVEEIPSLKCSIIHNTEYDDFSIDFEKVKQQVKEKEHIKSKL